MKRRFQFMTACVLLLSAGVAQVFANQTCKPVVGHFEANVVPPGQGHCPPIPGTFCTAGRVWGGIQGNYQFVMTGAIPSATIGGVPTRLKSLTVTIDRQGFEVERLGGVPTILFFTGRSTIFLRSGDQLLGTDTGSIDLPPGLGGFASLITFTGGTGETSGSTGQIRLRGEFNAAEATTNGDYIGTLCTP